MMSANLTVQDLFKLILFLLGIGVLTYLIIVLSNINKLLGQARAMAENNLKEIDTTIKQLPEISENINAITKEAKNTLETLSPEVNDLLKTINSISGKVEGITSVVDNTTHKVGDTVDLVSDGIAETVLAFKFNAKNASQYLSIIREVIDMIKKAFYKL